MNMIADVTADPLYLGYLVEWRFFDTINNQNNQPIAEMDTVVRASHVADVRGVDGIIKLRPNTRFASSRIPFQIKLGGCSGRPLYQATKFGLSVPVVYLTLETSSRQMRRRIFDLMMNPVVQQTAYDNRLLWLERQRQSSGEYDTMQRMKRDRCQYERIRMHDTTHRGFA